MSKYSDLINYEYRLKHERMTIENRSAQFSPFSALIGYEELINEAGRETSSKVNLSMDEEDLLNMKLQIINNYLPYKPKISITYFIKDFKKNGGKYITVNDYIKKIDFTKHIIILSNNNKIKNEDILEIDSQDINFNDII